MNDPYQFLDLAEKAASHIRVVIMFRALPGATLDDIETKVFDNYTDANDTAYNKAKRIYEANLMFLVSQFVELHRIDLPKIIPRGIMSHFYRHEVSGKLRLHENTRQSLFYIRKVHEMLIRLHLFPSQYRLYHEIVPTGQEVTYVEESMEQYKPLIYYQSSN